MHISAKVVTLKLFFFFFFKFFLKLGVCLAQGGGGVNTQNSLRGYVTGPCKHGKPSRYFQGLINKIQGLSSYSPPLQL